MMIKAVRYYIADYNGIPLKAQPERGYTELQVIARVQREIEKDMRLFGWTFSEAKDGYRILNNNFHECKELYDAI